MIRGSQDHLLLSIFCCCSGTSHKAGEIVDYINRSFDLKVHNSFYLDLESRVINRCVNV